MTSSRVQSILAFTLSRCLYFGLGISFIINKGKNLSILACLIGFIIGYFILRYITNKDFKSFSNSLLGKIIIVFLCIYITNYTLIAFTILASNFYLTNTPTYFIAIPLFIVILYGVKCGFPTITRLSELLIIISVFIFIIISISIFVNIRIDNYLPMILKIDINFIECIISTIVYSITPNILLLYIVKDYNKNAILKGYMFGSLSIFLTIIGIIGVLGSNLASIYRYPEYKLLQQTNILNFLEKQETFFALIWFINLLITSLISQYIISTIFKNKYNIIALIIVIISLIFFINNYQNALFIYNNTNYILLIPLIIFLFIKSKKTKSL